MSWLFGSKKASGKTILIIDVENESVGCALVRVSKKEQPKVFAEHRTHVPMSSLLHSEKLLGDISRAAHDAVRHTAGVAARMRHHGSVAALGEVFEVYVFFSAPWSSLVHTGTRLEWHHEPEAARVIGAHVAEFFGAVPVSCFASATAIASTLNALFTTPSHILVAHVTGEVSQLYTMRSHPQKQSRSIVAGATIPLGSRAALRTLQTHGGLSHHEAQSAATLLASQNAPASLQYAETLQSLSEEYGGHFGRAVGDMQAGDVGGILVVSDTSAASWLARELAEHSAVTSALFDEGAFVQTLGVHHILPHVAAHAAKPDLLLLLEAVFADKKYKNVK